MNTIDPTSGVVNPPPSVKVHGALPHRQSEDLAIRRADTIELSNGGLDLAGRDELSHVRAGLIDRVRSQIADGTYQSRQKIDVLVERLAAELNHIDLLV